MQLEPEYEEAEEWSAERKILQQRLLYWYTGTNDDWKSGQDDWKRVFPTLSREAQRLVDVSPWRRFHFLPALLIKIWRLVPLKVELNLLLGSPLTTRVFASIYSSFSCFLFCNSPTHVSGQLHASREDTFYAKNWYRRECTSSTNRTPWARTWSHIGRRLLWSCSQRCVPQVTQVNQC